MGQAYWLMNPTPNYIKKKNPILKLQTMFVECLKSWRLINSPVGINVRFYHRAHRPLYDNERIPTGH